MCTFNIKSESNIHSKLHQQLQPIPVSFRVLLYPTYYCNRISQQYNGLWFPQCDVLLVSTTLFVGICWPFYIIGSLNDSIVSNLSRTKNKIETVCSLTLKYCFAFTAHVDLNLIKIGSSIIDGTTQWKLAVDYLGQPHSSVMVSRNGATGRPASA